MRSQRDDVAKAKGVVPRALATEPLYSNTLVPSRGSEVVLDRGEGALAGGCAG